METTNLAIGKAALEKELQVLKAQRVRDDDLRNYYQSIDDQNRENEKKLRKRQRKEEKRNKKIELKAKDVIKIYEKNADRATDDRDAYLGSIVKIVDSLSGRKL